MPDTFAPRIGQWVTLVEPSGRPRIAFGNLVTGPYCGQDADDWPRIALYRDPADPQVGWPLEAGVYLRPATPEEVARQHEAMDTADLTEHRYGEDFVPCPGQWVTAWDGEAWHGRWGPVIGPYCGTDRLGNPLVLLSGDTEPGHGWPTSRLRPATPEEIAKRIDNRGLPEGYEDPRKRTRREPDDTVRLVTASHLRKAYREALMESEDGEWFVCARCKTAVGADDGADDDFPGLCSRCWCEVEPQLRALEAADARRAGEVSRRFHEATAMTPAECASWSARKLCAEEEARHQAESTPGQWALVWVDAFDGNLRVLENSYDVFGAGDFADHAVAPEGKGLWLWSGSAIWSGGLPGRSHDEDLRLYGKWEQVTREKLAALVSSLTSTGDADQ